MVETDRADGGVPGEQHSPGRTGDAAGVAAGGDGSAVAIGANEHDRTEPDPIPQPEGDLFAAFHQFNVRLLEIQSEWGPFSSALRSGKLPELAVAASDLASAWLLAKSALTSIETLLEDAVCSAQRARVALRANGRALCDLTDRAICRAEQTPELLARLRRLRCELVLAPGGASIAAAGERPAPPASSPNSP